jgi:hypothetical protein
MTTETRSSRKQIGWLTPGFVFGIEHPSVILFGGALLFFALTAGYPISEGDGAQYLTFARTGEVLKIPVHVGYLLLARAVVSSLGFIEPALALRFVSLIFGAIGVAATYRITWHFTGDKWASWLAALVLMTSGMYWFVATVVEVYIVQAGTLLAAYALWLSASPGGADAAAPRVSRPSAAMRTAAAVALVAFAGLVSPTSAAFLPIFLFGRPIARWVWLALAAIGAGLAGLLVLEPQILSFMLIGRDLIPTLWGTMRDLVFMGISFAVVIVVTIAITAVDGLRFPDDARKTRQTRVALAGIGLTVLCHVPVASVVSVGPFVPTFGLIAAAFGMTVSWLRAQRRIAYRSLLRAVAGLIAMFGLAAILILNGEKLHVNLISYSLDWLGQVDVRLTLFALGLAAFSVLAILWLMLGLTGRVRVLRIPGALALGSVFLAHLLVSLSLVMMPRQQIVRYTMEMIRVLEAIDPPKRKLTGTFSGLMMYDYEHEGRAEWTGDYLETSKTTPEAFSAALDREGELFLVGYSVRRTLESRGVLVPEANITPLYEGDYLWLVTDGDWNASDTR